MLHSRFGIEADPMGLREFTGETFGAANNEMHLTVLARNCVMEEGQKVNEQSFIRSIFARLHRTVDFSAALLQ